MLSLDANDAVAVFGQAGGSRQDTEVDERESPVQRGNMRQDEEMEEEFEGDIQIPLADPDELDDDVIDDDPSSAYLEQRLEEMRARSRTLSTKLRETVELFNHERRKSNGGIIPGHCSPNNPPDDGSIGATPPPTSASSSSNSAAAAKRNFFAKNGSNDSAISSSHNGSESRRVSLTSRAVAFLSETPKEFRPRRSTITSKWPMTNARRNVAQAVAAAAAATMASPSSSRYPSNGSGDPGMVTTGESNDSQFCDDEFDELMPVGNAHRRLSAPEKALLNADFAILKQKDRELRIVGAFRRTDDPFKQYMQSVTCYDVAPRSNAVCVIDSSLPAQKAVVAYCSTGMAAALILNVRNDETYDILTVTDCLHIFRTATRDDSVPTMSLKDYYAKYIPGKRVAISASYTESLWDIAKLFKINRVHRIPVIQDDSERFPGRMPSLMYFLTLRRIFTDVFFKLIRERSIPATSWLMQPLSSARIGTWNDDVPTAPEVSTLGDVINILLDRETSCIALTNEDGWVSGILTKSDIMCTIAENKDQPFTQTLQIPAIQMVTPTCLDFLVSAECTVELAMITLVSSHMPSLFVVDNAGERVRAVVSYEDIMDYIIDNIERRGSSSISPNASDQSMISNRSSEDSTSAASSSGDPTTPASVALENNNATSSSIPRPFSGYPMHSLATNTDLFA